MRGEDPTGGQEDEIVRRRCGSKRGGLSPAEKRKSQSGTSLQVSQPASKSDKYDRTRDDNNVRIINLENKLNDVLEIINPLYEGPQKDVEEQNEKRVKILEDMIIKVSKSVNEIIKNKNNKASDKHSRDSNEEQRETILYPEGEKRLHTGFPRFYSMRFKEEDKGGVNPFEIKRAIREKSGSNPEAIASEGRQAFTIRVGSEEQGRNLVKVKEIKGEQCSVEKHSYFNRSKGIIYIHEFDIDDLEDFKAGVKENYNVAQVEPITFIKLRYALTKVFLITFKSETPPDVIYIPGERSDTRVYSFHEKSKLCKNLSIRALEKQMQPRATM